MNKIIARITLLALIAAGNVPAACPNAPALIPIPSPTFDQRPLFQWHTSSQITTYQLQASYNADFSSPIISLPVTDTFYQPTVDLSFGTLYWKVGDFDSVQCWSETLTVVIQDSLQPAISVSPAGLNAQTGYQDSVEELLSICNTGRDTLTYRIGGSGGSSPQVLAWTYLADLTGEYANTIAAIRQYTPGCIITTTSTTAASTLRAALAGKDVFLVTEPTSTISSAYGTAFAPVLQDFVNNGGVVIFCCPYNYNYLFINATGLANISTGSAISSGTLPISSPGHPIFNNVIPPLLANSAVANFRVNDSSSVLATYSTNAVVAEKQIGQGHVVLLGADFFAYDSNWAKIISNAVMLSPALPLWISCAEDSGIVLPGACHNVSFWFRGGSLPGPVYTGAISIFHNSPFSADPVVVPCTLQILPPEIAVSPASLSASLRTGDSVSQALTVSNTGVGVLNFSLDTSYAGGGQIILNEVCTNPDYMELWNRGPETDIGGWRLVWVDNSSSSGSYTIPAGTRIGAGKCIAFRELSGTSNDSLIYIGNSLGWVNTTTLSVSLLDNTGTGVDFMRTSSSVTSPPSGTFWYGTLSTGYGWRRNQNTDTDSASDWTVSASAVYSLGTLNPGQSPVTVLHGTWLSVSYDSARVLPGGSLPITVTFNATDMIYSGLYVDSLVITHNAQNVSSPVVVRCSLQVISTVPDLIAVTPDPTPLRRPQFLWHSVGLAGSYTIQINTTNDFTSTYITQPVSDTSYVPSVDLPIGPIYWRVRSDLSSVYSLVDDFTVQTDSIPLIIPVTPETLGTLRPVLTWHPARGGTIYNIQIDTSGTFANPLVTVPVADTLFRLAFDLPEGRICWRVSNTDYDQNKYSAVDTFYVDLSVSPEKGLEDLVPVCFGLSQNFPNPFNPRTVIAFAVPPAKRRGASGAGDMLMESRWMTLKVFDMQGRLVRVLKNSGCPVGFHRVEFDGRSDAGAVLPSGLYFCRMRADGFHKTLKMFMAK
jgi:hypothetical protein